MISSEEHLEHFVSSVPGVEFLEMVLNLDCRSNGELDNSMEVESLGDLLNFICSTYAFCADVLRQIFSHLERVGASLEDCLKLFSGMHFPSKIVFWSFGIALQNKEALCKLELRT